MWGLPLTTSASWTKSSPPAVPAGPSPQVSREDENAATNQGVPICRHSGVDAQEHGRPPRGERPCPSGLIAPVSECVGTIGPAFDCGKSGQTGRRPGSRAASVSRETTQSVRGPVEPVVDQVQTAGRLVPR